MGVRIDKARRDNKTRGVNACCRARSGQITDTHNAITTDSDIRVVPGVARSVDDSAVFNNDVVGARVSLGVYCTDSHQPARGGESGSR